METQDFGAVVDLIKTTGSGLAGVLFFCLYFVARQWIRERSENQKFERQMLIDATKALVDVACATREMASSIDDLNRRQELIIGNQAQTQSMIRGLSRQRGEG